MPFKIFKLEPKKKRNFSEELKFIPYKSLEKSLKTAGSVYARAEKTSGVAGAKRRYRFMTFARDEKVLKEMDGCDFTHDDFLNAKKGIADLLEFLKSMKIRGPLEKGLVPRQLSRRKNTTLVFAAMFGALPWYMHPELAEYALGKNILATATHIGVPVAALFSFIWRHDTGNYNEMFLKHLQDEGLRIRKPLSPLNLLRMRLKNSEEHNRKSIDGTIAKAERLHTAMERIEPKFRENDIQLRLLQKSANDRVASLLRGVATLEKEEELAKKDANHSFDYADYKTKKLEKELDSVEQSINENLEKLLRERQEILGALRNPQK